MYAYIKGTLADLYPDRCVIDTGSIGYNIIISQSTANKLPPIGGEVKLYTYTSVREDALELLGFLNNDDLNVFKDLISVSGIGPKSALNLLSIMDADQIRIAIATGDVKSLSKAPGMGKKSAERLIVDLKGKYGAKGETTGALNTRAYVSEDISDLSENAKEALEALTALGFNRNEAIDTIRKTGCDDNTDVDTIISEALKIIR